MLLTGAVVVVVGVPIPRSSSRFISGYLLTIGGSGCSVGGSGV